jgi:formate hydrogenlyase subunit 6/NADH:ubiquinone oxidoreductase subunit I
VNTVFNATSCVLCGRCVDVCPEGCLRIVSVSRLLAQGRARSVLETFCGEGRPDEASAIIKDEARCIRCSHCADLCPVGAITMERFSFQGAWHEQ